MCWQPLLRKHNVTCFLCGLTPACYATMGRLRFLRGLFRGNNGKAVFSLWSVPGLYSSDVIRQWVSSELSLQLTESELWEPVRGRRFRALARRPRAEQLRRKLGDSESTVRKLWVGLQEVLGPEELWLSWEATTSEHTPGLRRLVCVCLTVNCKV
jgi:hypothetical protein